MTEPNRAERRFLAKYSRKGPPVQAIAKDPTTRAGHLGRWLMSTIADHNPTIQIRDIVAWCFLAGIVLGAVFVGCVWFVVDVARSI